MKLFQAYTGDTLRLVLANTPEQAFDLLFKIDHELGEFQEWKVEEVPMVSSGVSTAIDISEDKLTFGTD